MKYYFTMFLIFCLVSNIVLAQVTLKCSVPSLPIGEKILLSLRYDTLESVKVDSIVVREDGTFSFTRGSEIELYTLSCKKCEGMLVFVWDDNLTIHAKTTNLFYADIEGSILTNELRNVETTINQQIFEKIKPISDSIEIAQKQYDIDKVNLYKSLKHTQYAAIFKDIALQVRAHRDTFVGLFLLYQYWDSLKGIQLLTELPDDLKKHSRVQRLLKEIEIIKDSNIGASIPSFSAKMIDGTEISSEIVKGKLVLLDF